MDAVESYPIVRKSAKASITVFLALLLCALVACATQPDDRRPGASSSGLPATASPQDMDDREIVDAVVDNFMLIAEVPRPSHHEEKISAFPMDWAKGQGLAPVQDSHTPAETLYLDSISKTWHFFEVILAAVG